MDTVWVLGDQLNRQIGALGATRPGEVRVLLVESEDKLASKPFHRQRLHVVLASMRRFAAELAAAGYEVDHRRAPSLATGLAAHRDEHRPDVVRATEPLSWDAERLLHKLDVELVRSNQFLCHRDDFAAWADGGVPGGAPRRHGRLVMEDFYRWQRQRLGYLMDGEEPVGARWNLDADNREPPPKDGHDRWPEPTVTALDEVDRDVLAGLPDSAVGADPTGWWPTSRSAALARLEHFVDRVLPQFGPHEDAMLSDNWHLAHSMLSSSLNLGLLLPGEVCDAVEEAYRAGRVPLNSAEGFLRQVIGWREYVWGLYWRWSPEHRDQNELRVDQPLPAAFTGAETRMHCLATTLGGLHERAWVHHIQRLMVLSNLAMLTGVEPTELVDWMWRSFVDGSEWVMVPNVVGMGLHADGGRMATKPYASGGAYINRMSDYCSGCYYDPKQRVGERACPYTTLYWDFLARNRRRFSSNHRMAQPLRGLDRLRDLPAVRARAVEVRRGLAAGTI